MALAKIGTPATVEPLRRAMKEGNAELRALIAGSIGRASRALAMPLVAMIDAETDQTVVREYYCALGRIGTGEAVRALVKAASPGGKILKRKTAEERIPAIEGLRLAGAATSLQELAEDSDKAVRDAVKSRVEAGRDMTLHYDHPILLLQHMLWHEGYHHGQIKLALKASGRPLPDKEAGPLTWRVWMRKSARS